MLESGVPVERNLRKNLPTLTIERSIRGAGGCPSRNFLKKWGSHRDDRGRDHATMNSRLPPKRMHFRNFFLGKVSDRLMICLEIHNINQLPTC